MAAAARQDHSDRVATSRDLTAPHPRPIPKPLIPARPHNLTTSRDFYTYARAPARRARARISPIPCEIVRL